MKNKTINKFIFVTMTVILSLKKNKIMPAAGTLAAMRDSAVRKL